MKKLPDDLPKPDREAQLAELKEEMQRAQEHAAAARAEVEETKRLLEELKKQREEV